MSACRWQGPRGVPHPRGDGDLLTAPGAGLSDPVLSQGGLSSTIGVSPLSTVDGPPMQRSRHISLLPKPLTKMGFDEVSAQWTLPCPSVCPCGCIHPWQSLPRALAEPLVPHPVVARQAVSPLYCDKMSLWWALPFLPRSSSSTWCGDRTGASGCWHPCRSWRSPRGWWMLWMGGDHGGTCPRSASPPGVTLWRGQGVAGGGTPL